MRVLVVGANGLIGGYVTARLIADGHAVVGAGRIVDLARRREPRATWVTSDMARISAADWRPLVSGVDAVINCAGALQNGPHDDLEAVHVDGLVRLATAAMAAGVRRFVQVSAVGVESGQSHFSQTKARAETALAELDIEWIVIRPGLVLAPAAYGGSALLRGLAAFPWVIPAVHAGSIVQVVSAEDVAACAARAIVPGTPARFVATLTAERATTLADCCEPSAPGWVSLRRQLFRFLQRSHASARRSPMGWRGSVGAVQCARPRSINCAPACEGVPTRAPVAWDSRRGSWTTSCPAGHRACRSAGSPGCSSSSRS